MKKFLITVDMQKDFVDGALGSAEAVAIVPAAARKIREFDGDIFVTFDTHSEN
ncbi:MAG: isochorismatase family protein, partial [Clostridia bacterium]|nr:isochorismatase family protein [Clostridia bacterium]